MVGPPSSPYVHEPLWRCGWVLICRAVRCETENPLWGLTTHPLKPEFTPGGSTGGEGALLALQGSLVGWGTDIGGSVRIPAHMCGLYGFKPSVSHPEASEGTYC